MGGRARWASFWASWARRCPWAPDRPRRCTLGRAHPVPADPGAVHGAVDDVAEPPAARLDHGSRADVAVFAGHQHPVNPDGAGDDEALPQDLGRVAAPPVRGKDAVADVAALSLQVLGERMPDGRPADDLARDLGHKERAGNPVRGQADADLVLGQGHEVRAPRHSRLKAMAEGESVCRHRGVAGPERRLVVGPQRPQAKRRIGAARGGRVGDHRITLTADIRPDQ